ncbi:MAG: hypothetical protein ACT6RZ_00755 [Methylophilus sp.]|uniref:hypothetical protein n=1 Tax=Methylophilus sp. TaxID=29541 RepID=UPI004036AB46
METIRNQELNNLKTEIHSLAKTPKGRLKAIISVFSDWSDDVDKQKVMRDIALKMDFNDIEQLRNIITEQVASLNIKKPNDLTDQILFIVIGALKFEIKRETFSKHWQLAESSLDSVLTVSNRSQVGLFNAVLLSGFILIIGAILYINQHQPLGMQPKTVSLTGNNYLDSTEPMPSPYVPSHFYSLRKEMGKSVCLIPQAATLPAEQRAAFLNFIKTGEIDLDQLTNLQAALSLVHCEYTPLTIRLNH